MPIDPCKFLQLAQQQEVVDVRSPSEYNAGHIPGAVNLPLFNDEERKIVGTLYKQIGRDEAIKKGLEIAGPRLSGYVSKTLQISPQRQLLIHCWRGGLRSRNMAWLLELAGFRVQLLEGGYKSYRNYIRKQLEVNRNFIVLGGKTGSGKTEILDHILQQGYQILNLEQIANHKGSAFGDLGQDEQPSNEQFENNLFKAVDELDQDKITWVEDESRGIGRVGIPEPFFNMIRNTELVFLDVPKSERILRLVKEYSGFPGVKLASAISRISKKLGGLNSKLAIDALEVNDYHTVADILLYYYDKAYLKGLSMRDQKQVNRVPVSVDDPPKNATIAIDYFLKNLLGKFQSE